MMSKADQPRSLETQLLNFCRRYEALLYSCASRLGRRGNTSSMSHDAYSLRYDLSRLHNPWEKFTQRDTKKHRAEDRSPLCPATASNPNVIKLFLTHGSHALNDPVPCQRQLLRDFLTAAAPLAPAPQATYLDAVHGLSTDADIALLDDRERHMGCAKIIDQPCGDCRIFSQDLTVPQLCTRLRDEVGPRD
jgi:hypothetical protein